MLSQEWGGGSSRSPVIRSSVNEQNLLKNKDEIASFKKRKQLSQKNRNNHTKKQTKYEFLRKKKR